MLGRERGLQSPAKAKPPTSGPLPLQTFQTCRQLLPGEGAISDQAVQGTEIPAKVYNWTRVVRPCPGLLSDFSLPPGARRCSCCSDPSPASCPHRPTETMFTNVANGLYIAEANGSSYVIICLDFSGTFDTLSHLLFLTKKKTFFSFCDIIFSRSPPYPHLPFLSEHPFSSFFFSRCSSLLGVAQCPLTLCRLCLLYSLPSS